MHRTLFNTPVVNTVLKAFSAGFLKAAGDIERDMADIKAFDAPFKGKNAQQFEV